MTAHPLRALLAVTFALGTACGGGAGSSGPMASPTPTPLAGEVRCATTGGLPEDRRLTWRIDLTPQAGAWSLAAQEGFAFPHPAATPPSASFQGTATGRNELIVIDLSFPQGHLLASGREGAEGQMWVGTAQILQDSGLAVSCWQASYASAYHYDPTSGRCVDAGGQPGGFNLPVPGYVRETRDGECTGYFAEALNEADLTNPDLADWRLAGAVLGQTSLHFASLSGADLRGADFSGFQYGYATIQGTVDAHTANLPGGCTVTGPHLSCTQ